MTNDKSPGSEKLKNKAYKPVPTMRVYIPKANGKLRPLGIASYEDKLVQTALKKIIEAVYEPRFLGNMFGFRPKRGCHDALKAASWIIEKKKINWILDADIKGFFDNIDHNMLIKCIDVHIKDMNIIRLIRKYLKAGIMENDEWHDTVDGVIQGSNISPVLANIYMHYVLNLWFYKIVKRKLHGDAELVIYADDFLCFFQRKEDAEWFYDALQINIKLMGHYRYYGITDNTYMIALFQYKVKSSIFKWLNRRSQRRSYTWEKFHQMLKYYPLARPKIYVNIYDI